MRAILVQFADGREPVQFLAGTLRDVMALISHVERAEFPGGPCECGCGGVTPPWKPADVAGFVVTRDYGSGQCLEWDRVEPRRCSGKRRKAG